MIKEVFYLFKFDFILIKFASFHSYFGPLIFIVRPQDFQINTVPKKTAMKSNDVESKKPMS